MNALDIVALALTLSLLGYLLYALLHSGRAR